MQSWLVSSQTYRRLHDKQQNFLSTKRVFIHKCPGCLHSSTCQHTPLALNKLHVVINKKPLTERHRFWWAETNAGRLKTVLPHFYQNISCATRGEKLQTTFGKDNGSWRETAAILWAPNQLCYFVSFFHIILYLMLPLPSVMTENSFWISEQWSLTSNWTRFFSLMSPTRRIYCFSETRPKSLSFAWRKDGNTGGRRSECLVRIRRRVGNVPLQFVLLANVQSLENKLDDLHSRLSYRWSNGTPHCPFPPGQKEDLCENAVH